MAHLDQPTPTSDIPWPKRTNKACCSCRRDKIKCDGERPCSACLRKGLTNDKCIDGCPPCRRSRARCDGGDPCGRCLELGIDCSEDPVSPSQSVDESLQRSSVANARPAQTGRAKLACQACRRDNKKCDDNRPCSRCISRMEECIHVERIAKAVKHRCINCRKENRKCEDNRPCRHCAELNLECTDAPRKGSGGTRVKMACANCRRNKVQCDPERPCRVCMRRGLECTMPSCTCAETGCEPGTCTFCRSQRSARNSQTHNDAGKLLEERQSSAADTAPSSTSNVTVHSEITDFRGSHSNESQYHAYDQYPSSLGHSIHTDIPMTAHTYTRQPYAANYTVHPDASYQQQQGQQFVSQMTHAANTLQLAAKVDDQEQRTEVPRSTSQAVQQPLTTSENPLADFGKFANEDTGSMDKYSSRGLNMGTSAHLSDFFIQSGFIPQYAPASQTSTLEAGLASDVTGNFNNGVGVGVGTYESGEVTGFSGLSQAYGPVPMAMPVSVTIPVPQGPHVRKDTDIQSAGQIDMHSQLRRSAYYLTSDSRTTQQGNGP